VTKFERLRQVVSAFRRVKGRDPTFWLDKVCIDQTSLGDSLKVLPINVMACRKMLVLFGPTYPRRLWCVWELCTLFSFMRHEQGMERLELVPLHGEAPARGDETLAGAVSEEKEAFRPRPVPVLSPLSVDGAPVPSGPVHLPASSPTLSSMHSTSSSTSSQSSSTSWSRRDAQGVGGLVEQLSHFDLSQAHCYDPNEETRVRRVIAAVGSARFETLVRSLGHLWSDSQVSRSAFLGVPLQQGQRLFNENISRLKQQVVHAISQDGGDLPPPLPLVSSPTLLSSGGSDDLAYGPTAEVPDRGGGNAAAAKENQPELEAGV